MGTLDCDKVYFLTKHNYVNHLTVIKTEATRFCKKVGQPGCIVPIALVSTEPFFISDSKVIIHNVAVVICSLLKIYHIQLKSFIVILRSIECLVL